MDFTAIRFEAQRVVNIWIGRLHSGAASFKQTCQKIRVPLIQLQGIDVDEKTQQAMEDWALLGGSGV